MLSGLNSGTGSGRTPPAVEIPDSEFTMDVDLVLLAMGFVGPVKNGLIDDLGVEYTPRGTVKVDDSYMSSVPGVFAAGDTPRSKPVVWAISDGRKAARGVDEYLMGHSYLLDNIYLHITLHYQTYPSNELGDFLSYFRFVLISFYYILPILFIKAFRIITIPVTF